jgi:hypothetical protein
MPKSSESAVIKLLTPKALKLLFIFIFVIVIMMNLQHINHGTGKFAAFRRSTSRLQELKAVGYWGGMQTRSS